MHRYYLYVLLLEEDARMTRSSQEGYLLQVGYPVSALPHMADLRELE